MPGSAAVVGVYYRIVEVGGAVFGMPPLVIQSCERGQIVGALDFAEHAADPDGEVLVGAELPGHLRHGVGFVAESPDVGETHLVVARHADDLGAGIYLPYPARVIDDRTREVTPAFLEEQSAVRQGSLGVGEVNALHLLLDVAKVRVHGQQAGQARSERVFDIEAGSPG